MKRRRVTLGRCLFCQGDRDRRWSIQRYGARGDLRSYEVVYSGLGVARVTDKWMAEAIVNAAKEKKR